MQTNIIPNIYEAFRAPPKEIAVASIFPSSTTQTLSQIAYFLKKQAAVGERIAEMQRNRSFEELAKADIVFGKKLIQTAKPIIKYKFVVPNSIGFPVIGISSNIRDINKIIANALGVPNYNTRAKNKMPEIQAGDAPILFTDIDQRTNIITRNDSFGQPVKIFITRYFYYG